MEIKCLLFDYTDKENKEDVVEKNISDLYV